MHRRVASSILALLVGATGVTAVVTSETAGAITASAPSVLVIGDSVTVAAETRLISRLGSTHDLVVDATESRSTAAAPELVAAATAGSAVDVLVVELGYNDGAGAATFAARVDAVIAAANADVIVWLTLREDERNAFDYGPANNILRTRAAASDRFHLLDWNSASAADDTTWDGIHLTPTGVTLFADVVSSAIATAIATGTKATCTASQVPTRVPDPASGLGYWLLDSHGGVHAYGGAEHHGDLLADEVDAFPRSFQATATGLGYWIVDEDGGVHAYGDATFAGDMTGTLLNAPIRRLEAHPLGTGYWLVASDGGVFSFGAAFHGSTGAMTLRAPVISLSATSTGNGYWLVAGDGGVFTFGDAAFRGSAGGLTLDAPVIDLAADPDGDGYWLYAEDGGVFSYGLDFHGSAPAMGLCELPTTVAMRVTSTGDGYWLVTDRGWVLTFGDAVDYGGRPALAAGATIIDIAVVR